MTQQQLMPRWLRWTTRALRILSMSGVWLGFGALVIVILLTGLDPVSRALGLGQIDVSIPLSLAGMVVIAGFALPAAQSVGDNPEFTVVSRAIPARFRWIVRALGLVIVVLCLVPLISGGWDAVQYSLRVGERTIGSTSLPVWPLRLVLVIGMLGLLLECVKQLIELLVLRQHAVDPHESPEGASDE